jgi:hypothetical protein
MKVLQCPHRHQIVIGLVCDEEGVPLAIDL